MRAVALFRDEEAPRVVDRPKPEPTTGEALVRTLRVGIDGTDRRIVRGEVGEFPDGEDHLIFGHEAVGVVINPNGTAIERGDIVVPTVRRPTDTGNAYFRRGEPDVAPEGTFVERGISGSHGYMAEYFTSPVKDLVVIPRELASYGFLVEPTSISVKALEIAYAARPTFTWQPESALVLGNGSLGLTALATLTAHDAFERTYCLGRRDRDDPSVKLIQRLGATYIDSRETPVSEIPSVHEQIDLIFESTGHAEHVFELVEPLAPNGVGTVQGVPSPRTFEVDGGRIHRELVVGNKALIGVVNARSSHFEAAVKILTSCPEWFRSDLVTGIYSPDEIGRALDFDHIKSAIEFASVDELDL